MDSEYEYKRTILITGSTDGIGRQTALELAAQHKENFVIIHGRNDEKCKSTIEYIVREAKLPDDRNLGFVVAEFSELKNVAEMVRDVEKRFPHLNVLLCNAGVLLPKRTESSDGLELTFQVNYMVPFILSRELFGLLKKNAPARMIFVSSICYDWHPMDWADLQSTKSYEKYTQYSRTKLMLHMMVFKLARLIEGSGVTSNVLEPGVIETKLLRAGGYRGGALTEGSRAPVFMVLSPELSDLSGVYVDNNCKRVTSVFAEALDESGQDKIWRHAETVCEQHSIQLSGL